MNHYLFWNGPKFRRLLGRTVSGISVFMAARRRFRIADRRWRATTRAMAAKIEMRKKSPSCEKKEAKRLFSRDILSRQMVKAALGDRPKISVKASSNGVPEATSWISFLTASSP